MSYWQFFKNSGVVFEKNVDAFKNHIEQLKKRLTENLILNIDYEEWMKDQISKKSWAIAQDFVNEFFKHKKLKKIEIFLIGTYIEMQGERNE